MFTREGDRTSSPERLFLNRKHDLVRQVGALSPGPHLLNPVTSRDHYTIHHRRRDDLDNPLEKRLVEDRKQRLDPALRQRAKTSAESPSEDEHIHGMSGA